jgi:ribosomal protein S18 acetylase RimI-like enzyme
MTADFIIRPMQASDVAVAEPLWRSGFFEMAPHSYKNLTRSCTPLFYGAALGGALFAAGLPSAGLFFAAGAALLYTPVGSAVLRGLLWCAIRAQRLGFPPPSPDASHFMVAERRGASGAGELLGCVCVRQAHTLYREAARGVSPPPGEASVWRLTVALSARRLGVGRALMGAAEAWAHERGCGAVSLITGNPDSAAFYRRLGYSGEAEARARRVLFGESGAPAGPLGWLRERTLANRLRATIFVKMLQPPTSVNNN